MIKLIALLGCSRRWKTAWPKGSIQRTFKVVADISCSPTQGKCGHIGQSNTGTVIIPMPSILITLQTTRVVQIWPNNCCEQPTNDETKGLATLHRYKCHQIQSGQGLRWEAFSFFQKHTSDDQQAYRKKNNWGHIYHSLDLQRHHHSKAKKHCT